MKILQLGKFFPPDIGGIETIMSDITISLNKRGIKCDVLCSNSKFAYREEILPCGAKIMRCASFGKVASTAIAPQMIFKLRQIIANYDIIHLHLPDPMATFALIMADSAFRNSQKKVILHWHSDIIRQKFLLKFYAPFQKIALYRTDCIITTSPNYLQYSPTLQEFAKKVVAIPIGVDSLLKSPESAESAESRRDKKTIFALGRLVKYKGFEYLVESMRYLPDFTLYIAGDGKELANLKAQIKSLHLENRIFLLGKVDRNNATKIAHFNEDSVFVLPSVSRNESFGVVQIEAMSCKMPVVSTNIKGSGVPWVNKDGESGVIVPLCDARAIAEAVLRIMSDYGRFAEGAKARYETHFTLDKMVDEIIALYDKMRA